MWLLQEGEHSDPEEVAGGKRRREVEEMQCLCMQQIYPSYRALGTFSPPNIVVGGQWESLDKYQQVSRFLFFAKPEELKEALLDIPCLDAYFLMLEEREATCAIFTDRISCLSACIKFYAMVAKTGELPHIKRVKGTLKNWTSVYSQDAKRENRERLEDLSEAPPSECVNEFIQCKDLQFFNQEYHFP